VKSCPIWCALTFDDRGRAMCPTLLRWWKTAVAEDTGFIDELKQLSRTRQLDDGQPDAWREGSGGG
jgi:hypothetical protein